MGVHVFLDTDAKCDEIMFYERHNNRQWEISGAKDYCSGRGPIGDQSCQSCPQQHQYPLVARQILAINRSIYTLANERTLFKMIFLTHAGMESDSFGVDGLTGQHT